ncbi:MAG: hypothetical protein ACRDZ4_15340 [Egibacteraceae bacterium]
MDQAGDHYTTVAWMEDAVLPMCSCGWRGRTRAVFPLAPPAVQDPDTLRAAQTEVFDHTQEVSNAWIACQ